jgi:hypothetical protein
MEKTDNKKTLYSQEYLLAHKLPYKEREENLVNSLCDIMLRRVGKDFYWAKEHDYEDLHIIDLLLLDKENYDEFSEIGANILKKQLGCSKTQARKEMSWFLFDIGLGYYDNDYEYTTLDKYKESIRKKIEHYEEKHGELKYSDGWEKELKEFCQYV